MTGDRMYRSTNRQQIEFPDFHLPFSGHLDPENRWVALARLVPWELAEEIYYADLCQDAGQPIVPARVALGALLVKERLGLTDRETVETLQENPYLQFFLGIGRVYARPSVRCVVDGRLQETFWRRRRPAHGGSDCFGVTQKIRAESRNRSRGRRRFRSACEISKS